MIATALCLCHQEEEEEERGRTLQENENSMSNSGGIHLKDRNKEVLCGCVYDLDNDMMSE